MQYVDFRQGILFMTKNIKGDFSVYLDNSRARDCRKAAYIFQNALKVIRAENANEIIPLLDRVKDYLAEGYYVAGWISYEAGLFLEDRLSTHGSQSYETPFLLFGVYENCQRLSSTDSDDYWAAYAMDDDYAISDVHLNISLSDYEAAVSKIHDYLLAGDIYQVNYTLKSKFKFQGKAESFFAALRKSQRVEYGAFLQSEELSVLSLSPELFFRKEGQEITARPMKGTCPRGRSGEEDQYNATSMQKDEKSRAENLMIVDLLRNDLAKISSPASVKLKSLYDIEKYRTLFQMTSTITAEVPEKTNVVDLIKALFPCGSVTGAPKIRAMEIIAELEAEPRGIYTGAIGYMSPEGECCFSVPIRTITLDQSGQGEMGIGSAIVADSEVHAEYEECLLKAQFATGRFREFALIETIRWSGEYDLLNEHLQRLRESADYFDFDFEEKAIRDDLEQHSDFLGQDKIWKVRLLLSRKGQIAITSQPITPPSQQAVRIITLSDKTVDSQNPMLFHKTTDRDFYDRELKQHQQHYDSYDVLFVNEKGHLTEGSYNNIFLQKNGYLITPPLEDGVLSGILRQSLLQDPKVRLRVESLTVGDLWDADALFMGNSVRGLVEVTLQKS